MAGIEHVEGLYGYAMVLTRNRSEAEDLVQDTYVRGLNAVAGLPEGSNLKAWLFTILRNLWFNELRRRRSAPYLVEMDGDDHNEKELVSEVRDAQSMLVGDEDRQSVRDAINGLSVEFREVILLREFEELSYAEIAAVLDCPAGTVMSRLGRARAKLRTALAATWQAPQRITSGSQ